MKIFPPRLQIFKSHEGQNLAVFSVGKSLFSQTTCHTVTYKQAAPSDSPKGGAWASRKGPAGLQRGPYCFATGLPLQPNEHAVAGSRGRRCTTKATFFVLFRQSKTREVLQNLKAVRPLMPLSAAQAPPLGESEGAFLLSHSALIAHKNANLQAFLRTRFCKHLSDIQLYIQLHPTPTKVLQNSHESL